MEEEQEEMEVEEVADNNNLMINALVELLVEKKVITEAEFDKKVEEMEEGEEDEE